MSTPASSGAPGARAAHPVARELKLAAIPPTDESIRQAADRRLDMLTKPLGSLGRLERRGPRRQRLSARGDGAMRRRAIAAAAALAFGLALSAAVQARAAQAPGISVRDDIGREVKFDHYPKRIVSLLPSLTETVCQLGACDRLVATDRFSDWPAQVNALPKTGGLDDAEIEEIVRLHPDLVLLSRSQRITDRLHELGVESFALDTQTYAAVAHVVVTIGAILGLAERATALNQKIERSVHEIRAQASTRRHGAAPTAYIEVDGAPYAAGPQSFIGEMLVRLGVSNIVTADLGPFPKLNPEYVVRHDPDVIFLLHSDALHLADRPGWDQIRAVKEHRVCSFPSAVLFTIIRPGPRVADGMRAMEECLERVSP